MLKLLLPIVLMFCSNAVGHEIIAGKHFHTIDNPLAVVGKKPVIIKYFSFQCPGCYSLENDFAIWLKDKRELVEVVAVPVTFGNKSLLVQAKGYYIAKHFGKEQEYIAQMFAKIHFQGKTMSTKAAVLELLSNLGIEAKDASPLFNAVAITNQIKYHEKHLLKTKVMSLPTLVINHRYTTNPTMSDSKKQLWQVLEYLMAKMA